MIAQLEQKHLHVYNLRLWYGIDIDLVSFYCFQITLTPVKDLVQVCRSENLNFGHMHEICHWHNYKRLYTQEEEMIRPSIF